MRARKTHKVMEMFAQHIEDRTMELQAVKGELALYRIGYGLKIVDRAAKDIDERSHKMLLKVHGDKAGTNCLYSGFVKFDGVCICRDENGVIDYIAINMLEGAVVQVQETE